MVTRITGASRVAPGLFEDSLNDIEGVEGVIADLDDACVAQIDPLSGWSRGFEQTRPPVSPVLHSVAAVVKRWTPTNLPTVGSYAHLCRLYSAVDLDVEAFVGGRVVLIVSGSGDPASGDAMLRLPGVLSNDEVSVAVPVETSADRRALPSADEDDDVENTEVGAPSSALLVEAVEQLRAWLHMPQQDLSRYVGLSPSTVMSWKREAPRYPRHRSIPALLALRAAVGVARAELGHEAVVGLVWSRGEKAGAPVIPAAELTETLLAAVAEASDAAWLEDDGYVVGQSVMPSAEELLVGETVLAEGLAAHSHTTPDTAETAEEEGTTGQEPDAPLA